MCLLARVSKSCDALLSSLAKYSQTVSFIVYTGTGPTMCSTSPIFTLCGSIIRGSSPEGLAINIFLRMNRLNGTSLVLSPTWRGDHERVWSKPPDDEAEDTAAENYFARQVLFDPDI